MIELKIFKRFYKHPVTARRGGLDESMSSNDHDVDKYAVSIHFDHFFFHKNP